MYFNGLLYYMTDLNTLVFLSSRTHNYVTSVGTMKCAQFVLISPPFQPRYEKSGNERSVISVGH